MNRLSRYLGTDIRYFFSGGSWLLVSQGLITFATILITILFANLVPVETYGTYKYIISVISIFSITSLSGINVAYARAVSRGHEANYAEAIKAKIAWSSIGAAASFLFGVYYLYMGNSALGLSFIVVSLCLPFVDTFTLFQSYLNGKSEYKRLSFSLTGTTLIHSLVVALTLFYTDNVVLIISAYIVSKTLTNLFWSYFTLSKIPVNDQTDNAVLSYGKHLSFMKGITIISGSLYSLGLWQFGGAASLAYFALAIAPAEQLRSALKYIEPLILPKTSRDVWDKRDLGWFLKKTFPLTLFTLVLTIIYFFCAPILFSWVFPQYLDAVWYSQLYMVTLFLTAQSVVVSAVLKAKQETQALHILTYTNVATDFLLCLPGIYLWGVEGLISMLIVSKVLILVMSLYLLYRQKA
jgi:O-antigen/teichoic acid export membrane protein